MRPSPKPVLVTEDHPLFDLAVRFHSGQLSGEQRASAKNALFVLHYGNYDMSKVHEKAKEHFKAQE